MYFKSTCLALGALVLTGFTVGAEGIVDTCDIAIEGATVSMSQGEVELEWLGRGYLKDQRFGLRRDGSAPKDIKFNRPNGPLMGISAGSLTRVERTHHNDPSATPFYQLRASYSSPRDVEGKAAYRLFQRGILMSWCNWAGSNITNSNSALICTNALAGQFDTVPSGVLVFPSHRAVPQTWNGCNWIITSSRYGDMSIEIVGPVELPS
jgi:hypothetical protein